MVDINNWQIILNELDAAIESGEIATSSKEQLNKFAIALCQSWAHNRYSQGPQYIQICETVRTHLLRAHIEKLQNHVVELHNHITSLNKKNKITQYCVIALTIAALIGTSAQVWYAKKADRRSLLSQQQTISLSVPKITEPKNNTGASPMQSKPVPQIYQIEPKNDVSR
jgi:hypothetical protein